MSPCYSLFFTAILSESEPLNVRRTFIYVCSCFTTLKKVGGQTILPIILHRVNTIYGVKSLGQIYENLVQLYSPFNAFLLQLSCRKILSIVPLPILKPLRASGIRKGHALFISRFKKNSRKDLTNCFMKE